MPNYLIKHHIIWINTYPQQFLLTYGPTSEECTWTKVISEAMRIPAHNVHAMQTQVLRLQPEKALYNRVIPVNRGK